MADIKRFGIVMSPRTDVVALSAYGTQTIPRLIHPDGGGQVIEPDTLKNDPEKVCCHLVEWIEAWINKCHQPPTN